MASGRDAVLVATCDQWVRGAHDQTAVDGTEVAAALTLSWDEPKPPERTEGASPTPPCPARGLAVDRLCRVYRALGDRIERLAVGSTADGVDYRTLPDVVNLIGPEAPATPTGGTFEHRSSSVLGNPTGIAIDDDDRLFISDADSGTIAVIDTWSRRLLRTVPVANRRFPNRRPAGLATNGRTVTAVVQNPAGLVELSATRGPTERSVNHDVPADAVPLHVGLFSDGTPVVLYDVGGESVIACEGVFAEDGSNAHQVVPSSDLIVANDIVILAPCPSADGVATLSRFSRVDGSWNPEAPLDAQGYDGTGIVATADGRVGYFAGTAGFRLAAGAAVNYATSGHCVTYRLDSQTAQNRWGRVLLEACVPKGTSCVVGAVTSDDDHVTEIPHTVAHPASCKPAEPMSAAAADPPPLPPVLFADDVTAAEAVLHRRGDPVTPWWNSPDSYETFEAPVIAEPGRYLWITIRLTGNGARTPRIRELRVEKQAHTLLRRLPGLYSSGEAERDFLHRYLGVIDGFVHDLELRSRCRDILVDPMSTPAEALDWLGSFVGLVLDDRWAEQARRRLIAEIVPLFRLRGTVWALTRYIEIFLMADQALNPEWRSVQPIIIEHYRLRGVGGPVLTNDVTLSSRTVVGAGFRVGGAVGELGSRPLDGDDDAGEATSYASHAHRFTVLIPRPLIGDEEAAVRSVLDRERPAHTDYELCTVDAGMRAGDGLHLGMSSIVGRTGAFESAILDHSLLGRGAILGGATTGMSVEAARLGQNAVVG